MSAIPGGVRVQGFIAPTSINDTYPVIDPHYGLGGLRTVLNLGQRDLIPAERRIVGMLVYVQAANKYYKLLDDLVQWEEVDLSNILTNESDPTVPLHVKRIPAGTAVGQILRWNGSDWLLATIPAETDPTVPTHVKQIPQGSTNGQFLRWNGTQWTAADGSQLPEGTQAGQVLQWNGTTWIAAIAPSGGITSETDPTVPNHVKQIPHGGSTTTGGKVRILEWSVPQQRFLLNDVHVLPNITSAGVVQTRGVNTGYWVTHMGNLIYSSSLDIVPDLTGAAYINLLPTGVTAGTYNNPTSITVDLYGRIINISGAMDNPTPTTPGAIFEVYFGTTGIIAVDINSGFFLPIGYGITVEFLVSVAADFIDQVDEPFVVEISQPASGQFVSLNNIPSVPFSFGGYFDVRRTNEMDYEILAGLFSNATGEYSVAQTVYSVGGFDDFSGFEVQVWTLNNASLLFSVYQIENVTLYQF